MSLFFTSDTHFGHQRQVGYRNFESVAQMDTELIRRWNSVVSPKDTVYHLGDFAFGTPERTFELVSRLLHGSIKLVPGNHDHKKHWKSVQRLLDDHFVSEVKFQKLDRQITLKVEHDGVPLHFELCHFPMLMWNKAHYGAIHLHGHCHGSLKYPHPDQRIMDVGVDVPASAMAPWSLDEIVQKMRLRGYIQLDHHVEKTEPSLS